MPDSRNRMPKMSECDWQPGPFCQYWQDTVLLEVRYASGEIEIGEACGFGWGRSDPNDPYTPSPEKEIVCWRPVENRCDLLRESKK